jgi:hypothetical protein
MNQSQKKYALGRIKEIANQKRVKIDAEYPGTNEYGFPNYDLTEKEMATLLDNSRNCNSLVEITTKIAKILRDGAYIRGELIGKIFIKPDILKKAQADKKEKLNKSIKERKERLAAISSFEQKLCDDIMLNGAIEMAQILEFETRKF